MNELTVIVTHRIGEDRRSYFDIKYPSDQEKLTITHTTMMLAAGISLLVKAGHKLGDFEDYKRERIFNEGRLILKIKWNV